MLSAPEVGETIVVYRGSCAARRSGEITTESMDGNTAREELDMAKTKGSAWLTAKEYFARTCGDDAVSKVMASLSREDQKVLSQMILSVTWIDYDAFIHFMLAADKMYAKGDGQLIADMNIYQANKDMHGLYKVFLALLSPETVIKVIGHIWRQFYDTGTVLAKPVDKHNTQIILTDFPDIPLHHDWENTPYMVQCLRLARCKNPRATHTKCIARGDEQCLWEFTWD
jgi:hypothetical protein